MFRSPVRLFSSGTARLRAGHPAFVFDIDGVLKQGDHVLPEAKQALQLLNKKNIPYVFLTNGGGYHESVRAEKLSADFGFQVPVNRVIQCHTLYEEQAEKYKEAPVLIIGGKDDQCRQVAESYGFSSPIIPYDILASNATIWPFHTLTPAQKAFSRQIDLKNTQFKAIFVFHDSRDWGTDVQVAIDVLVSKDGIVGNDYDYATQSVPVYFSNADLLWGNEFPQPRLGQGAFHLSLSAVYKKLTGNELEAHLSGKPTVATYQYAWKRLQPLLSDHFNGKVFMVGDNPSSDIAGANNFNWQSILVRTGVFRGKVSDSPHKPTIDLPNVLEGVNWALKQ